MAAHPPTARRAGLLLQSALAVATRQQREHQPTLEVLVRKTQRSQHAHQSRPQTDPRHPQPPAQADTESRHPRPTPYRPTRPSRLTRCCPNRLTSPWLCRVRITFRPEEQSSGESEWGEDYWDGQEVTPQFDRIR